MSERSILTITKWLKVGKHNALSGDTAPGRTGSALTASTLALSPFGHGVRPSAAMPDSTIYASGRALSLAAAGSGTL